MSLLTENILVGESNHLSNGTNEVFIKQKNTQWKNSFFWFLTLFLLVLFVITKLHKWMRVFTMAQQLPGPKGHILFGNAKEFLSKHQFFYYAHKWREDFPHFHKTFILFHPLIIIQSPEAVQTILSRKHKHNEKGFIYKGLRPLLGEGLITSKGERWHTHRKLITPTFHFNILEGFVDVFVRRTKEFMMELEKCLINFSDQPFIDISPHTRKLTLDFICETAMGTPINSDGEEHANIVAAMHKLEEIGTYRMVRPWLLSDFLFQFTVKAREEEKFRKTLHDFTDLVIKQRRKELKESPYKTSNELGGKKRAIFMDLLIETADSGENLTDADIREEVNTFMFAGQNTTQLAINFSLYLFGLNPDIQEKAYQEMQSIFGDSDRNPTMEDLKNMRYLENCIKDALRLFPSVPVIARRLTEDEVIGKHTLPKGADVLIVPYVLHRNANSFPNPEEFNPDNFLSDNIKKRHAYSYIPFSAGPRNCIGQKFAILAEKTVLSAILRKYIVSSQTSRNDLVVVPNTVLVPKGGIKLKLTARKT